MVANPSSSHLVPSGEPERIAVVRALQLGDMLCAVPALRALRAAFPDAEITLVGLAWADVFVERFDRYLDRLLELPGWPALPEVPARIDEIPRFLAEAQRRRFDLALQMHGSGEVTNAVTALLGARMSAGFFRPDSWCPDTARFLPYPDDGHEIERLLALVDFLGIPRRGDELEFPLRDEDFEALASIEGAEGLVASAYACVHPGGHNVRALWPAERFAAVGDELAARGLRVVVTGTGAEAEIVDRVVAAMRSEPLVLAGRTSLGALGALLLGSRLLVANDTGVVHLAAALAVPAVVLFHEHMIRRWAPLDRERHRVVLKAAGPEDVVAEADDLLRAVATPA